MTNQEYEAASIAAAGCYERFEGEHKLKQLDEHIAQVEKTLASLHLMRREIVNQYNLNKCWHGPYRNVGNGATQCVRCMEVFTNDNQSN